MDTNDVDGELPAERLETASPMSSEQQEASDVTMAASSDDVADADDKHVHQSSRFTSAISRVLSNMDFDHCDPDMAVDMLRSPSTKVMSALNRKLRKCGADWIDGFLDAQGFDVSKSSFTFEKW